MVRKTIAGYIFKVFLICTLAFSSIGSFIVQNALAAEPSGSMAASTLYLKNNETKAINAITIVDSGAEITALSDIRILIPATFTNLTWDTSDTTATIDTTGNVTGMVSATVSYTTTNYANDTLILDVTFDFTSGDTVTFSDLSLVSGNPATENTQSLNWSVDGGLIYKFGAATVIVDTTAPSGYSISIDQSYVNSFNETNTTFTFAAAEVGATYSYSVDDTNGATPAVTGSGTVGSANQTIGAINVSSLDDDTLTYTVYLTDLAGNQGANATDTVTKDTTAPTVTDANISIAGGTGTGGAYIIGDTITVTWDNSAAGDNNTDLNTAFVDLSGWGGPAAVIMTDTTACGGTAADNIYEACYTIAGTEGIDGTNINAKVTATDNAGNSSVAVGDTTNATVDTVAPNLNAGSLSIDTSACTGTAGTCIIGDAVTFTWNNTVATGDNNADEDPAKILADLSNFGGVAGQLMYDDGTNGDTALGDDIYSYTYTVLAGTNDGTYTFDLLISDDAGNTVGPTTSLAMAAIDNQAPTVTAGCISVTGATGTAGAFKVGDAPVPTWDNTAGCDNNGDIASVTFDASDFRAADTAAPGVNTAGTWTGTITGPIDAQDTTSNNIDVSATDDAGNTTTITGTNNYTIDTQLPSFTAVQTVEALKQDGAAPTVSTTIWYYYPGQNLRLQVNNASETDGNDLVSVKACMRSMNEDVPSQLCSPADFANPANYQSLTINAGADDATLNYALAGLPSGWPTQVDGYQINFELEDDAGNVWWSANAAEFYYAVFNVDPKVIYTGTPDINNATTTDWSTITDFTAATNVVFNANDGTNDVGRITITGSLNLTTPTAISELQNLAANMTVTGDQGTGAIDISIDHTNLSIFNTGATITIRVPTAVRPGLVVRNTAGTIVGSVPNDEAGAPIIDGDTLGGFTWDVGTQTLTFTTTGFSSFGADQTAPTALYSPAHGSTGQAIAVPLVITFSEEMDISTFTYTLTPDPGGTSVTWGAGDTVATIAHNNFAYSTSYTLAITAADDMVGNSIVLPSSATFTTAAAAPVVPSGGSAGGTRPDSNLTTPTTPTEAAAEETPFVDMVGHWAETYIDQAYIDGYIEGYPDNTFKPNQNINRAEAAKLVALWFDMNITSCDPVLFNDVNCTDWFGKYVTYLFVKGIILGYNDGSFAPGSAITRAEALKMMLYAKALQNTDISGMANPFSDVVSGKWYYDLVLIGYKLNIVEGYQDGTFGPNKPITRAEFTKIFIETLVNN